MAAAPLNPLNIVHLADNSATSCKIFVCCNSTTGVLTAVVNGVTYTATGDSLDYTDASNVGIGIVECTGVNNGDVASVYVGGTLIDSIPLVTKPTDDDTWSLVASGCFGIYSVFPSGLTIPAVAPDARLFISLGDAPYLDAPETGATITRQLETLTGVSHTAPLGTGTSGAKDLAFSASIHAHCRAMHRDPGMRTANRLPTRKIRDDHEFPGNNRAGNFLGTVGGVGDANIGINFYYAFCANETEAAHYNALCDEASNLWYVGNPSNNDSNRDPNWPPEQSRWYRERYGSVEIFYIDIASYRDPYVTASPRNALHPTEETWLLESLAASTATWKILATAREMYSDQDGMEWAPEQRDRIMAAIAAQSGWAVTGAVVAVTADNHMGGVKQTTGYIELVGCPGGVEVRPRPDGYIAHETFKDGGYITSIAENNKYMSVIRVYGTERLDMMLVNDQGQTRWHGYLLPGDMEVRRERRGVA